MKKLAEAVKEIGLTEAANRVGESPQCIANWIARGVVPTKKCPEVERVLGVSRRDLRPNDWQRIWPDLVVGPRDVAP